MRDALKEENNPNPFLRGEIITTDNYAVFEDIIGNKITKITDDELYSLNEYPFFSTNSLTNGRTLFLEILMSSFAIFGLVSNPSVASKFFLYPNSFQSFPYGEYSCISKVASGK